jgi:uncharacterized short protein YbdD (DUF466 family)
MNLLKITKKISLLLREQLKKLLFILLSVYIVRSLIIENNTPRSSNFDAPGLTQTESPDGKKYFITTEQIRKKTPPRQVVHSRDFFRYVCKDKRRVGGGLEQLNRAPNSLNRIDGAWFTCFDDDFALKKDTACTVLSFGINNDPSFDQAVNKQFGCRLESFDPFVEANQFKTARKKQGPTAVSLPISDKWTFHRIGLSAPNGKKNGLFVSDIQKKIGVMATLDQILAYTGLTNKPIDLFKMDIEMAEWPFLEHLDMNYFCSHVKQFHIETHPTDERLLNSFTQRDLQLIRKLEKCFVLFHRNTRFFARPFSERYGTPKTEFEDPITYKVPLNLFGNEQDLIDYMVVYGELYFVNRNFVKHKERIFDSQQKN